MCDWAVNIAGDLQDLGSASEDMQSAVGEKQFPNVHAWTQRFRKVASDAEAANLGAGKLEEGQGAEDEVVKRVLSSELAEPTDLGIDASDVLVRTDELKAGQRVSVAPADFGYTHKDEGVLVGLSSDEVVIETEVPNGEGKLRLHYPRINFKVMPL